ncbi:MAG: ABC transporter ATP-binding protein [Pseudomonadota bacterium]
MFPTHHPFARLWRGYLRRHLAWIVIAALLMAIEGGAVGLLAWMLQPMFDTVFADGRSDLIVWVGLSIMGLFLLRGVTGVAQRVILARVAFDASARLQQDLLTHVLRLDTVFFSTHGPGTLIERVQGDVQSIQTQWTAIVTAGGRDAVGLVSLLIVALLVDPVWTFVAAIGAPLLILPSLVVQRYIKAKSILLRDIAGTRTTRLDEIFHGIGPIKLNGMEDYQASRFQAATQTMVRATIRATAGQATVPALVDAAIGVGFLAVLIYGGPQIIAGEKSIGEFMSFFTAMSLAFQPLRRLAGLSGLWQAMMASLERIYALRDTVLTLTSPATAIPPPARLDIALRDVHLRYGENTALRGVTFEVPEGSTTALVGRSGAGKSSIFSVLTRLVDPDTGYATLGGHDLRDMDLAELRGLISVVSQDILLFDETLRDNITLGRDVPEDRLRAAIEAAHLEEVLADLPNGLDTRAGPRGSNLSGGQRQRVAIARAILRDTPILLLDEATSALDPRSERAVQAALATLSTGRTTLVIAHRLSTVRKADRIVVLDAGRVAECGDHAGLLVQNGLYRELHDLQFGS